MKVESEQVDISPYRLQGLRLRGTVSLAADHAQFGGFSGLLMNGPRLIAVTDKGWWLLSELADGPDGLQPGRSGFAPMLDQDGAPFESSGSDAEGLTVRDGLLVVSFERDDRIMFHVEEGRLGDALRARAFERLGYNKGIEALATTPDGWLIGIVEKPRSGQHPVFLVRYSGEVEEHGLPEIAPFHVTGADVGPDGRLYVLRRYYSQLLGVSMRIHRYDLTEDGLPVAQSAVEMAAFESESGIDNMEGIALWQDREGRTRLALISDDNFNWIQRTLLMDFEVLE